MIAGMTAFGRTECDSDVGRIVWEIRTVNHRYLEMSLRLPEELRMLETGIREHISNHVSRGKIDCTLRFEPLFNEGNTLSLNSGLIRALLDSAHSITSATPGASEINPLDVLRWPGVINREIPDPEQVGGPVLQQLDKTLEIIIAARRQEGEKIYKFILDRCDTTGSILQDLENKYPEILSGLRERMQLRAQELQIELDRDRLEQEILLLSQKYDVSEELDRLKMHIREVKRVLESEEPVGRRLDFLMQELNREANTLGSKSAHYDCTNASVELKVLIEQMREQIQNVE